MDEADAARATAVRLVRAAERIKADFAAAVAPLGLSVPAARALLLLDEPMAMGDVSERLACDKSYITRIADELEEQGLARRTPSRDRRVQLLKLTPAGVRMRGAVAAAAAETNPVALQLGDAERSALDRALRQLLPD